MKKLLFLVVVISMVSCGGNNKEAHSVPDSSYIPINTGREFAFFDITAGKYLTTESRLEEASAFSDGLALCQSDGKLFYMDKSGKAVSEYYESATVFVDGVAWVRLPDGKLAIIDNKFNVIKVFPNIKEARPFYEGISVATDYDGYRVMVTKDGSMKPLDCSTCHVRFKNGLLAVQSVTGRWGAVNENNESVFECRWNGLFPLEHSVVVIDDNDRFGIADTSGNIIIAPRYKYMAENGDGYIFISDNGSIGWCDGNGNNVVNTRFSAAYPFGHAALAPVADDNGNWGYVDRISNIAIECKYDEALPFDDATSVAPVRIGNKWGLLDRNGQWVVEPCFELVKRMTIPEMFIVRENGRLGIIDFKGAYITQFEYGQKIGDKSLFVLDSIDSIWGVTTDLLGVSQLSTLSCATSRVEEVYDDLDIISFDDPSDITRQPPMPTPPRTIRMYMVSNDLKLISVKDNIDDSDDIDVIM